MNRLLGTLDVVAEALPRVWMGSKGVVWRSGADVRPGLEWVVVRDGEEQLRLPASGRMSLDFRRTGPGVYSVCLIPEGWPITDAVSWKQ